jgi:hypothetical protein
MTTDDDPVVVTHPIPIDVSSVRDTGMQALITLAHSLGWNVHQKRNQPVVITARDGVQKRLPTNTSIRMGVFQSALSTIMVHSEDPVPSIELMDGIIDMIKVSTDHARRLRLAVGESPTQHRERVLAIENEAQGPREPQPLTQRIEIPEPEPEDVAAGAATDDEGIDYTAEPAADDGKHGKVISVDDFLAVRQVHSGRADTYISDTSFVRTWEDGYVDYVCQECGKAYLTPKGVGSHSQVHSRRRDIKEPAWMRAKSAGRIVRPEPEPAALEWVEPPGEDDRAERFEETKQWALTEHAETLHRLGEGAPDVLGQIVALVTPELVAEIAELRAKNEILALENERLGAERDQLQKDWTALKDLIGGR